jgi:hypothetical protein
MFVSSHDPSRAGLLHFAWQRFEVVMKTGAPFVAVALSLVLWIGAGSKPQDPNKTDMTLRASPAMAFAPARITLSARLKGGPDDNAELYCPTVEWDWGDGTVSESSSDCDPFQPSKSEIQRNYSTQHVYKYGGEYIVQLRLKKQSKVVATANAQVNIGLGLGEGGGIR